MKDVCEFNNLIFPYTSEEFFNSYYEKNYLYISRNNENHYNEILNIDDIDLFFQNKNIHYSCVRVVKNEDNLPPSKWTYRNSSIANNDKLLSLLNRGNTLILLDADRSIPKLISYCSELGNELQSRLQSNIYITPLNAQAFSPHYDNHDVFILQTTGTKLWRLYHSPLELPSKSFSYGKQKDKYKLGKPNFEVELKSGDLLYIPRGLIHEAATTATVSVHITLALHPNYWFDLIKAVADLAENKPEFRQAVPNALMNKARHKQFKQDFLKLTQSLIEQLNVDALLQHRQDHYAANKRSEDQNRFKDSVQLSRLNLNSVLSRRKNILFKLYRDDKNVFVKFYDKRLAFPHFAEPSLQTFLKFETFAIKEIAGSLTNEEKINLATQFVQEGFLTIKHLNA